jgi:hypothetical protein
MATHAAHTAHPTPCPSWLPADLKPELRRLCAELLLLYAELLVVLAAEPDNSARLLTGIKQLLLNMQHLANCLRPAQVGAWPLCTCMP